MMKLFKYPARKTWEELTQRPSVNNKRIHKKVETILRDVKMNGDKAIRKYEQRFSTSTNYKTELTEELKLAIQNAKKNIEAFHLSQLIEENVVETMPGIRCWRKALPIEKVGLYVPGGTAPLFSTILMLAVPARLAGCMQIVMCCPSDDPVIRYTAELCGISGIYKIGGAQAIAAMAYGTETIPRVQKIFGPGNAYVTLAKQIVQIDNVAIDMPAGPSELVIIADDSANPSFIAADLLSQAEHGIDSQVLFLTIHKPIIKEVKRQLKLQLKELPREAIARKALSKSKILLFEKLEEALAFSNLYAPEHLMLACRNATETAQQITSAGSVFLGNYSPEAAGDYATGTNHTLPTKGFAAMYNGVSVDSFLKKITFQELTREGLLKISDTVMTMAEAEGLSGHKNSIEIRI